MIKIKIKLEDFLIGLLSGMAIMFVSVIIIFSSSSYIISLKSDFDFYIEEEKVEDLIKHNDKFYISATETSEILDYNIELKEAEGKMYLDKEEALAAGAEVPGEESSSKYKEDKPEETKLTEEDISNAVWEAKKDRSVILVKAINKSLEAKKILEGKEKKTLTVEEAFDLLIKRTGEDPSTLFYIEDMETDEGNKYYDFVYSSDEGKDDEGDIYYSVDKSSGTIDIGTSLDMDSASVIPYYQWEKNNDN